MRVIRFAVLMVLVALVVVPVAAQDEGVLALTINDILVLSMALVGLVSGLVGVLVAFFRMPYMARTGAGLDQNIQLMLDARRTNLEMMTALENTVDKLGKHNRQAIKEVAEVVLTAAQWVPGKALESAAELVVEATDGVPMASKIEELERRVEALYKDTKTSIG